MIRTPTKTITSARPLLLADLVAAIKKKEAAKNQLTKMSTFVLAG